MDDERNGAYSRAPEFEDLLMLCRLLNDAGVSYVLIGGFAVILHGFVRATKDIDLLIDTSPENVRRIKKALASLPDNAVALIEDGDVEKYSVVRIADEFVVDLMGKACGIDYSEAMKEIKDIEVEGVRIPVAKKELLIRMKDTIRPSDRADVDFLKTVIEEERKK